MRGIKEIVRCQREFFSTGKTKDEDFRARQLRHLYAAVKRHENDIIRALKLDLNKSPFESYETEIGIVYEELRNTLKNFRKWAASEPVRTSIVHFPSSGRIYREPYGTVLIMSPWNYPFQLAFIPLIGAIAAGNCAVLKPSAYAENTAEIISKIVREIFGEAYVSVVRGGREANRDLLKEKFDYIFFTGSPSVGRVVMKAAAENLTPVTLELGGKSPCIVDRTAQIDLAAKRIAWGKFLNAGQTCIAPDYLLVHRSVKEELVRAIIKYIGVFYGEHPELNKNFPSIINQKHYARLLHLMEEGKKLCGGQTDAENRKIAPVLIDGISWESPVMQEEIFGPVLPVLTFEDMGEVIAAVNSRPKPLALYLFTTSRENERRVMNSVSFGGGCVNDTIIHVANMSFAFGGVGESGMGQYHGKATFDTFTHQKPVVKKSNLLDIPLRYPPFKNHFRILKKVMR